MPEQQVAQVRAVKRTEIMAEIRAVTTAMARRAVRLDHLDHASPEATRIAERHRMEARDALKADVGRLIDWLEKLEETLR